MTKKSLSYQTLVYGVGSASNLLIAFALAAVMSRMMDKETYGSFRQLLFLYTTLSLIFSAGIPRAVSYFTAKLGHAGSKDVVCKAHVLLFVTGALLSCGLFWGADYLALLMKNEALVSYLKSFSPVGFLLLPTMAVEGVCMGLGAPGRFVGYQFIAKALTFVSVVVPVAVGGTLADLLFWWNVGNVVILLTGIYVCFSFFKAVAPDDTVVPYKELLQYSFPILVSSIAGVFLVSNDKFIVSNLFGTHVFAEYVNGAFELPFISIIAGSTTAVLLPAFSRLRDTSNYKEEILKLWHNALIKCAYVLFPVTVFFWVFGDYFISFLYGSQYSGSTVFFQIFLLLALIKIAAYNPILLSIGANKQYAIGHSVGAAFSALAGVGLCIAFGSPLGAGIAFVVTNYLMVVYFACVVAKKLEIPVSTFFPVRCLLLILMVSLLGSVPIFIMKEAFAAASFPGRVAVTVFGGFCYGALCVVLGKKTTLDFLLPVRFLLTRG